MRIDLKPADALTEAENEAVRALAAAVYPPEVRARLPWDRLAWAEPQWVVRTWDDAGQLVGFVGIHDRMATHDGQPVRIGGIGSVKTHPAAQGHGYATAALARAAAFLRDERDVTSALLVCMPDKVAFYGKRGWRPFGGTLLTAQSRGVVPFTEAQVMVRSVGGPAPHDGTIDLCGPPW